MKCPYCNEEMENGTVTIMNGNIINVSICRECTYTHIPEIAQAQIKRKDI